MCMWQQATWSLRLLFLACSWDKPPNTGEVLCCWAGLNFASLSTQNSGQTMDTSFFGPDLILQLACFMSGLQHAPVCSPVVPQKNMAGDCCYKLHAHHEQQTA